MDLFEYQGKQYFARYGIPVLPGALADTVDSAVSEAEKIGYPVVIKAQVQVGGRGKAGGIKVARNRSEAQEYASAILGMTISGHLVQHVWVEKALEIAREYYASFTLDRGAKTYLGMLSAKGGMDIEQVAHESPEAIARLAISPLDGLTEEACRKWVEEAHLEHVGQEDIVQLLLKLYTCYVKGDADLVEINPLILTVEHKAFALDAKVALDDNAAYRHPEWDAFRLKEEADTREQLAHEKGLQYIGLDGDIGIIANGAGLAMSTLDVVNQVGGKAANFLDIGGGANADVVTNALLVINSDPHVKSIFINIFGGITRCDEVANGIIEALQRISSSAPIVVRLDGTNSEQGRAILAAHANDHLMLAPTMLDGARKAFELAREK